MSVICPNCQEENDDDCNFCVHCGTPLKDEVSAGTAESAPPTKAPGKKKCQDCGSENILEGFCQDCGVKWQNTPPLPANSIEQREGADLAAVSNIGRRHTTNQDNVLVKHLDSGRIVMAVADGVSTSQNAEDASLRAVQAAVEFIVAGENRAKAYGLTPESDEYTLSNALLVAHAIVGKLPFDVSLQAELAEPQTTLVLALIDEKGISCAWAGDSRLYVLDATTGAPATMQLTVDDSWMNEAVAGGMAVEEALKSPHAHEITQCLGMRDGPLAVNYAETTWGEITRNKGSGSLTILACSDGLWNYFESPASLQGKVAKLNGKDAFSVANELVRQANLAGGSDNITAACCQMSLQRAVP